MTKMLDRAAVALMNRQRNRYGLSSIDIGMFDPEEIERAKDLARAVLLAVREETNNINDGMGDLYRAGFEAMFDAKFKDEYPMMSCGWEAMIDAILNERDSEGLS